MKATSREKTPLSGRRNRPNSSPDSDRNERYAPEGSPKSAHSGTSEMLDTKHNRKRAESDLQLLANRIALLRVEEQKAVNKIHETKARAEEILMLDPRTWVLYRRTYIF